MPSFLQTNKVKSKTSENKFVQCSYPLAINVLFLGQAIHGLARSELCVDSQLPTIGRILLLPMINC